MLATNYQLSEDVVKNVSFLSKALNLLYKDSFVGLSILLVEGTMLEN
jgi:hypothetical protein